MENEEKKLEQTTETDVVEETKQENVESVNENKSTDDSSQPDEKKPQSRSENARFAEMRRKTEALEEKVRTLEQAQKTGNYESETVLKDLGLSKGQLDETDKELYDSYVQGVLNGEKDPKAYAYRTAFEKKRNAEREAQREKAEQESKKQADEARVREDVKEFQKKYPDVDLKALVQDKEFVDYFVSKGFELNGNVTKYYSIYRDIKGIKDNTPSKEDKSMGTIPSASDGSTVSPSARDVKKMSDKEFLEYWKQEYGG